MLYLKPQSPIKNKENYIYPLTTYDQVILADGSRWTGGISEDDRAAIIREVVNALATPVYGRVDENNNIILGGNLPEGSYMIKYESADGDTTTIGTLTISTGEEGEVTTNLVVLNWRIGVAINSNMSGMMTAANGAEDAVTDIIAIEDGITYTYNDGGITDNRRIRARCYDSTGAYIGVSDNMLGLSGTSLSFVENAAYFRIEFNDYATSDAASFTPLITISTSGPTKSHSVAFILTNGIKLDKTTGVESSDNTYMASDYIEVNTDNQYKIFAASNAYTSLSVNCFDESKTQIGYLANIINTVSSDTGTQFSTDVLALPEETKYIRMRGWHADATETQIIQFINNYSLLCTEP